MATIMPMMTDSPQTQPDAVDKMATVAREPAKPKWTARRVIRTVVQFPLTRIILALIFVVVAATGATAINDMVFGVVLGTDVDAPMNVLLFVFLVCLAYALYVLLIERRSVSELSPRYALELIWGLLIGAGLFALVVLVLWLTGVYRVIAINSNPWQALSIALFAFGISPGVAEEIIFRGIIHRITEEGLGTWAALLVSSALFGLAHADNPNATLYSTVAIAIEAGLMLGIGYTLTRRLWVPIGMHIAWNFVQGGIFDISVSGIKLDGWFIAELRGPKWLTGGAFGAEASPIALMFCVICFAVMTVMVIRRRLLVPPFWVRWRNAKQAIKPAA